MEKTKTKEPESKESFFEEARHLEDWNKKRLSSQTWRRRGKNTKC